MAISHPRVRGARALLCGLSGVYLIVYAFVLIVAVATSGHEVIRSPGAWYAALAPMLYAAATFAYGSGLLTTKLPTGGVVLIHIAMLPALVFSFLGLGLLLPLFAFLWWTVSRDRVVQVQS